MSLQRGSLAPLLIVAAATLIPIAPVAGADPVWPVAGAESAADTISDLQDQGYTVAINWVSGHSTQPLTQCRVSAIHNPGRSPDAVPTTSTTVYVDVSCPDDHDWNSVGVGIGIG